MSLYMICGLSSKNLLIFFIMFTKTNWFYLFCVAALLGVGWVLQNMGTGEVSILPVQNYPLNATTVLDEGVNVAAKETNLEPLQGKKQAGELATKWKKAPPESLVTPTPTTSANQKAFDGGRGSIKGSERGGENKNDIDGGRNASEEGGIYINSCGIKELTTLKGIGPKTAEKIIAYRENGGFFRKPADLLAVKGIGPKKLESMRNQIRFDLP